MANLSDLDVVYAPYAADLSNAADRRRFPWFLRRQGVDFDVSVKPRPCDLAYITDGGDLSGWCDLKDARGDAMTLALDFVDMYFHYPPSPGRAAKGAMRFLQGRESRFALRHTDAMARACRTADVIFCASEDQRDTLLAYNDNVHITLDWFETTDAPPKSDFRAARPFRLGWEGQPWTLNGVNAVAPALNALADHVELHLMTNTRMKGRVPGTTRSVLSQIPDVRCAVSVREWELATVQHYITACDAMILPLDRTNFSQWAKPANRLISLWHLDMPVIASATRAFSDLQHAAGLDLLADGLADWEAQLERVIAASADQRRAWAQAGRTHAQANFNDARLAERWAAGLASCGVVVDL